MIGSGNFVILVLDVINLPLCTAPALSEMELKESMFNPMCVWRIPKQGRR